MSLSSKCEEFYPSNSKENLFVIIEVDRYLFVIMSLSSRFVLRLALLSMRTVVDREGSEVRVYNRPFGIICSDAITITDRHHETLLGTMLP